MRANKALGLLSAFFVCVLFFADQADAGRRRRVRAHSRPWVSRTYGFLPKQAAIPSPGTFSPNGVQAFATGTGTPDPSANPTWVTSFGATGDGVTDDTKAIQAAVLAMENYGQLWFPTPLAFYKTTDKITVSKPITLAGEGMPEIRLTVESKFAFNVTSDNVTFRGLKITGAQSETTRDVTEAGIRCYGTSAADPYENIRVIGCEINRFGGQAVDFKFVTNFSVLGNRMWDLNAGGFQGQSCIDGVVSHNRIRDLVGSQPYGITLTRAEQDSLITDPRSRQVAIVGNEIYNPNAWTGIDTHGGEHLSIVGNVIRRCRFGIALTRSDGEDDVQMFAPRYITVSGNVVDSEDTNGTTDSGIVVAGAAKSAGDVTELAEGITITGNSISRFGDEDSTSGGGIRCQATMGMVISNNTMVECARSGVNIYFENKGISVTGNTGQDIWSDDATWPGMILVSAENNTGYIGENTMVRGSRVFDGAIDVNTVGTHFRGTAGQCSFVVGRSFNEFGTDYSGGNNYATFDFTGGNITSGWINSATQVWDPSNTSNGNNASTTVEVLGAVLGDKVSVGFTSPLVAGMVLSGHMSTNGTATILLRNNSGSSQDLAEGTLRVEAIR